MREIENIGQQREFVGGKKLNGISTLILMGLFAATITASAKEPNYRSYFTYPDAQITIDWGDGHAEIVPFKNHSIRKTSPETPCFAGGDGEDRSGRSVEVYWRFIQKTDSGDLYLISINQNAKLLKEVPILYTGSTVVAYDRGEIKITVRPVQSTK
jgi:hypothetical protein